MEFDGDDDDDDDPVQEIYDHLNEALDYVEDIEDIDVASFLHDNLATHVLFMRDEYGHGEKYESNLDKRITKFDAKLFNAKTFITKRLAKFAPYDANSHGDIVDYFTKLEYHLAHYSDELRAFFTSRRVLGEFRSYSVYHNRERSNLPDDLMQIVNDYTYNPPIDEIYSNFINRFNEAHPINEMQFALVLDTNSKPLEGPHYGSVFSYAYNRNFPERMIMNLLNSARLITEIAPDNEYSDINIMGPTNI